MGILFVFEHGLKHSAVGNPPLLRVTVEDDGRISVEDVDEQDELSQRGEATLLPDDLQALRELVEPGKLKTLGLSLGHGPAWGRILYGAHLRSTIAILHTTPAGVLLPESVRGVAKAAGPLLSTLLSLFAFVAQSSDEPTQRRGISIPKSEQPIRTKGPHGTLLMRYHETLREDVWIKVFDTGVIERRAGASEEGDGKAEGSATSISTGLVAELYELVRRHLPKASQVRDDGRAVARFELYDANGKRDIRVTPLDGKGPFASSSQRAAAIDALAAFGKLVR